MTLDAYEHATLPPPARRVFCNRTLNFRSIEAIGFDMDYTLIHYLVEAWERKAYEHMLHRLGERGWPIDGLTFDPSFVTLGLVMDLELGNVVKANRFGYVKRACHGTRMLTFEEQRDTYAGVLVDLSEPRWVFMNTLFALSEATAYMQLVDLLDAGRIPNVLGYRELYKGVRASLDEAHMEGTLKAEILAAPDRFVQLDEELPLALLDLKHAGKKLLLITNSEWAYTKEIMRYAFDPLLPGEQTWRDLFHVVIVAARKPAFFGQRNPVFEVVDEDRGHLAPHYGPLRPGHAYLGGDAKLVEQSLGCSGGQILYVGDHIFADVNVSKNLHRWRTALVVRALEDDLKAMERFKPQQATLTELMARKELLEHRYSLMRLDVQRADRGYGPQPTASPEALRARMHTLRQELVALDEQIAPLAKAAGELVNERWGPLMRAGSDKSHLARQIERNADVYMSRVSNFGEETPFVYARSPRTSLPHDHGPEGGV